MKDTPDVDLKAFLSVEGGRVEAALERALEHLAAELPQELLPPARHAVLSNGKRLRPILCVTAYTACGGEGGDEAYDMASSLELIHAYSLMHDDLPCMDDADLRRGRETTHRLYGEEVTMRAGAALIPAAALQAWNGALALGSDEATAAEVVVELSRAAGAGGMVGGQVLDLLGEGEALSVEDLNGLHRRKTGALLAASLRMGALAAGAPTPTPEALDRYGQAIGLAFQIVDDVLDATSSAEELGKRPSDEELHKSTYVSHFGAEDARRRAGLLVEEAKEALTAAALSAPELMALADYIVERRR